MIKIKTNGGFNLKVVVEEVMGFDSICWETIP
jgi:hypothetical protein